MERTKIRNDLKVMLKETLDLYEKRVAGGPCDVDDEYFEEPSFDLSVKCYQGKELVHHASKAKMSLSECVHYLLVADNITNEMNKIE